MLRIDNPRLCPSQDFRMNAIARVNRVTMYGRANNRCIYTICITAWEKSIIEILTLLRSPPIIVHLCYSPVNLPWAAELRPNDLYVPFSCNTLKSNPMTNHKIIIINHMVIKHTYGRRFLFLGRVSEFKIFLHDIYNFRLNVRWRRANNCYSNLIVILKITLYNFRAKVNAE